MLSYTSAAAAAAAVAGFPFTTKVKQALAGQSNRRRMLESGGGHCVNDGVVPCARCRHNGPDAMSIRFKAVLFTVGSILMLVRLLCSFLMSFTFPCVPVLQNVHMAFICLFVSVC